ncbi:MAG: calcium/sodium antiporter [Pseudomonadota bacterium]
MLTDLLMTIGGLLLLLGAGDMLVRGAVTAAVKMHIPAIVISATVVAFGTSAPELLISIQAALEGVPGIALGNVIGSNIANVWLVLGIPALIAPIAGVDDDARRGLYFMLVATVMFTLLLMTGQIEWWGGLMLLGVVMVMLLDSVREGLRHRAAVRAGAGTAGAVAMDPDEVEELEGADPSLPAWKIAGLIVAGCVGLPIGAHLLIDGARGIALDIGVTEAAIGLTLVAIGTSLPELSTTVMAALRGRADVAIGNVVGSNLFNITAIIGAAALFAPLDVPMVMTERDIWVMIAATLTLVPYVLLARTLCRWTGAIYVAVYVAYLWMALS